jgi:hypothetical protein
MLCDCRGSSTGESVAGPYGSRDDDGGFIVMMFVFSWKLMFAPKNSSEFVSSFNKSFEDPRECVGLGKSSAGPID